jgi:hypothetical protein
MVQAGCVQQICRCAGPINIDKCSRHCCAKGRWWHTAAHLQRLAQAVAHEHHGGGLCRGVHASRQRDAHVCCLCRSQANTHHRISKTTFRYTHCASKLVTTWPRSAKALQMIRGNVSAVAAAKVLGRVATHCQGRGVIHAVAHSRDGAALRAQPAHNIHLALWPHAAQRRRLLRVKSTLFSSAERMAGSRQGAWMEPALIPPSHGNACTAEPEPRVALLKVDTLFGSQRGRHVPGCRLPGRRRPRRRGCRR